MGKLPLSILNGETKEKTPGFFAKNYPKASFSIINNENYLDFIL